MAMWRWHPCVVGGLLLLLLSAAIQVREVIAGGKCDIELKSTQDQIQDALLDLNEHATILHVEIPKGDTQTVTCPRGQAINTMSAVLYTEGMAQGECAACANEQTKSGGKGSVKCALFRKFLNDRLQHTCLAKQHEECAVAFDDEIAKKHPCADTFKSLELNVTCTNEDAPTAKVEQCTDEDKIHKEHFQLGTCNCNSLRRSRPSWIPLVDKIKGWKERGFNQDADYTPPLSTVPRPRILCVTYMIKKEHCTKGRAQLMTWGKRCDKLIHITDQHQPHLLPGTHVVTFAGANSYNNLWQKTRAAFAMIAKKYMQDYDWIVYGGSDLYVIVENLVNYLQRLSEGPPKPLYVGHRIKLGGDPAKVYNSGAGYTLNREAVMKLVKNMHTEGCQPGGVSFAEDWMLGHCLASMGIDAVDTRDEEGGERFHMFDPALLTGWRKDGSWIEQYNFDIKEGLACCAQEALSFHYMKPKDMIDLDHLLYSCP